MLKNKRILLIIIVAIALLLIPNICNAALTNATETTTSSTGATVKWEYSLENDVIVRLKCKNVAEVSGNVTIPSTIDGYKVVTIGTGDWDGGVFYKCAGLTGVIIPNTVTTIEKACFEGCSGLTSVVIPNSVTSIQGDAFKNTGISEITFCENISTIGDSAFENCSGIGEINLPNKLISIGAYAFRGCSGIVSLVVPDGVTTIGESAFENCSGMANLTLPANLTILNDKVFAGCKGLTSVVIPDKVTTISGDSYNGAFYNCTNLEKILIPDRVSTIEEFAFQNCSKLTIYGNDGKKSKQYAEDNNINFNYIANWDNTQTGTDIVPPTLESLKIAWGTAFKKDEGTGYYLAYVDTNISIKATFNEEIHGEKAPTLTIKCGIGDNIILDEGVIQGKYIVYTYRIQDKDKGIISAVSLTGGDVADAAGNKIEKYTCPVLTTDIWNEQVFANGTGTIVNNQGNGNNNSGNNGNNDNGSTPITLSSIAITTVPTKLVYTEGESFDKTGMVVTATYSDKTTKQVTTYTISLTEKLKTSDNKVVIAYTENGVTRTAEQVIKVNAKQSSASLSSIKITKSPTKTNYTEGNTFNKAGMEVTATYSDGTTKQITSYTISPSGTLKTTDKKVTITYTEGGITKTAEQVISVAKKVVKDDKDTTTKGDSKLPQTGATLLSLVVVALIVVAVVSKVKYGKYSDIK